MRFDDFGTYYTYVNTFCIDVDDLKDIFPWLEEALNEIKPEKPKSKRGRKPKAHRAVDKFVEMKSTN